MLALLTPEEVVVGPAAVLLVPLVISAMGGKSGLSTGGQTSLSSTTSAGVLELAGSSVQTLTGVTPPCTPSPSNNGCYEWTNAAPDQTGGGVAILVAYTLILDLAAMLVAGWAAKSVAVALAVGSVIADVVSFSLLIAAAYSCDGVGYQAPATFSLLTGVIGVGLGLASIPFSAADGNVFGVVMGGVGAGVGAASVGATLLYENSRC